MSIATDQTPRQCDALIAFMSQHEMSVVCVLAALEAHEHRAALLAESLGDTNAAQRWQAQAKAIGGLGALIAAPMLPPTP